MSLKSTIIASISITILGLSILFGSLMYQKPNTVLGSVALNNEYFATTTSQIYGYPLIQVLADGSQGSGALGSLIMTSPSGASGYIEIYDATTTNRNARTGQTSTSSILIASIPTNAAAGTYTYDAKYKYGLVSVITGTYSTTTITYR